MCVSACVCAYVCECLCVCLCIYVCDCVCAGATVRTSPSMFMVGTDGTLYERTWRGAWVWVPHGRPGSPTMPPAVHSGLYNLLPARPVVVSEGLVVCVMVSGQVGARGYDGHRWWGWEVYDVPISGVKPAHTYNALVPLVAAHGSSEEGNALAAVADENGYSEGGVVADFCSGNPVSANHCVFGRR